MNRRTIRWTSAMTALCATIGCSTGPTESALQAPPDSAQVASDAFIGAWRSVTPSYEFIRLSVVSKSSVMGAIAARLTLSGVAWEGEARVAGDSLIMTMAVVGTTTSRVMIARSGDAGALLLRMQAAGDGVAPIDLRFVRGD